MDKLCKVFVRCDNIYIALVLELSDGTSYEVIGFIARLFEDRYPHRLDKLENHSKLCDEILRRFRAVCLVRGIESMPECFFLAVKSNGEVLRFVGFKYFQQGHEEPVGCACRNTAFR